VWLKEEKVSELFDEFQRMVSHFKHLNKKIHFLLVSTHYKLPKKTIKLKRVFQKSIK